MHNRSLIRTAVALLVTLVFVGVVVSLGVMLRATSGQFGGGGIPQLGWLMPTMVAILVGVLGWAMLVHARFDHESPRVMVQCASCEAKLMKSWRMCPYCGRLTEDGDTAEG